VISLSDTQLKTTMAAASHVPYEKRAQFPERVAAILTLRGRGYRRRQRDRCRVAGTERSDSAAGGVKFPNNSIYLSGKLSGLPCWEGLSTGRSGRI
jgi:hypothetical protein